MRAALTMYDLPELKHYTDTLWSTIAGALRDRSVDDVPPALEQPANHFAFWTAPDLLLSQTCGYPLTHALAGKVRVVATPCYDAFGCSGAYYSSVVVTREDGPGSVEALRNTKVAFNSRDSQSGCAALRALIAPYAEDGRFFASAKQTGAHAASLAAVRKGAADVCAADAVTFALLRRHRPGDVEGLRIIGTTPSAPGLPLITALNTDDTTVARIRDALDSVANRPDLAETRDALLLRGFECLPAGAYDAITAMEQACVDQGYPELA